MERLRHEGEGILLIFDNAVDAYTLKPYLPRGGAARVLVTSNAHAWRGMATPVEIRLWPKEIGADYLMVRTGRAGERAAADVLSEALGGLPLAHEQAAAYCERLDISLADYCKLFEAAPARLLDDSRHAPAEYHDGLTVAKTFALAIEAAAKLHPAAEPLIVHAALLAPEPIPLFLFSEAREEFGEPLATGLVGDALGEAIAALRAFALVDREAIVEERDTSITTGAIRLHRLVREVAAALRAGEARDQLRRALVAALAAIYPNDGYRNPASWPRCALLTPHLLASCEPEMADAAANAECADLLHRTGAYFHGRAAFTGARPLFERALTIRQKVFGPEDLHTAQSLNSLAILLQDQGDLAGARPIFERTLAIKEKELGPQHPDTAASLNDLARLLQSQGDLARARPLFERALEIKEKTLGSEHLDTAVSLNNLANLLVEQGDLVHARPLLERASTIYEKALGPEHPHTAPCLSNLALLLQDQGDLAGARPLLNRVLAIKEKAFGPEHPETAMSLNNIASLLVNQGDLTGARLLLERASAIYEKALGPEHPDTAASLNNLARLLQSQGNLAEARPLCERALEIKEKALGPDHPNTAMSLNNLASLLVDQGDFAGARPLYERALVILENVGGHDHPNTNRTRHNLARLLLEVGNANEALSLAENALSAHEKVLGRNHAWSKDSARVAAEALAKLGRSDEGATLRIGAVRALIYLALEGSHFRGYSQEAVASEIEKTLTCVEDAIWIHLLEQRPQAS
jgi:tetratricopeptide (TPR) repeat protein